jgi:hypothetical protein
LRGKLEEDRAKYEYQENMGEEGDRMDRQSTWWFKRELII